MEAQAALRGTLVADVLQTVGFRPCARTWRGSCDWMLWLRQVANAATAGVQPTSASTVFG